MAVVYWLVGFKSGHKQNLELHHISVYKIGNRIELKLSPIIDGFQCCCRSPSLDEKRKGAFFVNLQDINLLKKYETMVLTLHEANPGKMQWKLASASVLSTYLQQ